MGFRAAVVHRAGAGEPLRIETIRLALKPGDALARIRAGDAVCMIVTVAGEGARDAFAGATADARS